MTRCDNTFQFYAGGRKGQKGREEKSGEEISQRKGGKRRQ